MDYRRLLECLNAPPAAVAPPWDDRHPDWHRMPHDPADCVTSEESARATLRAWPLRQKVLAALTAIEMAVPVWEHWARRALPARTASRPDDLRAAVREVRAWLMEPAQLGGLDPEPPDVSPTQMDLWVPEPPPTQALADRLYHAYEVAYSCSWVDPDPPLVSPALPGVGRSEADGEDDDEAEPEPEPVPGRYDARAASRAAYAAWELVDAIVMELNGDTPSTTYYAVEFALNSVADHLRLPALTVYRRWWSRVTARLAFADAATCEFKVLDLQPRLPVR